MLEGFLADEASHVQCRICWANTWDWEGMRKEALLREKITAQQESCFEKRGKKIDTAQEGENVRNGSIFQAARHCRASRAE